MRNLRRPTIMRSLAGLAACMLISCAVEPAYAQSCHFIQSNLTTGTINMGNVNLPRDAAVGAVVASIQFPYDAALSHQNFDCGSDVLTTLSFAMSGSEASGSYPTNIPGLGIRVYVWSNTSYYTTPTVPTLTPNSWTYSYTASSSGDGSAYGTGYLQIRIDLVITGPVDLGATNSLTYSVAPWGTVQTADGTSRLPLSYLSVIGTVASQSCTVTTPLVEVTLPNVLGKDLTTAGMTAGATPLAIDLNCPAGANVFVTLTDASNPANLTNIAALAPESSARGVGLQVLNGTTAVAFGPDSAEANNLNQWSAGRAAGGVTHIPLSAQYIRTSGPLVPGSVKGKITFTMSYQ
jgi:type 1 fimbria pilin